MLLWIHNCKQIRFTPVQIFYIEKLCLWHFMVWQSCREGRDLQHLLVTGTLWTWATVYSYAALQCDAKHLVLFRQGAESAKLQGRARQWRYKLRLCPVTNRDWAEIALFSVLPWHNWSLVNQFVSWSEIHWFSAIVSNNIQGVSFWVFFNMEVLSECPGGYRRFFHIKVLWSR